jgi:N-acyl homoserine lactone hydrolase
MQPLLKGAPKRLAILDYGLFQVHANDRIIGISGFVIETDAGERILIDTGFPPKYARDPDGATRDDELDSFGRVLDITDAHMAPAQLNLVGISPGDIDVMIQSHTHIDHIGHMDGFPQAPIVMARAERALDRPLYWSGKQPMEWPDRTYVLLDQDQNIGPGFDAFLVPGHAPGQLAFMLTLPKTGPVLLTSDAISRPAELDEKFSGSWNEHLALQNGTRLMQLAQDTGAWVIYGHCPAQWPTLRKAPHWYD